MGSERKTEPPLLKLYMPIYNLQKLGLIPRLQVDFSKINGSILCLGRDLRTGWRHEILVWSVKSVMTLGNWSQRPFIFFLQLLSCDLMFSIVTCFFQLHLISGRDMNSLS